MAKTIQQQVAFARHHLEAKAERLRYDARLAFLDGRTKRARDLNKQADAVNAQARKVPLDEPCSVCGGEVLTGDGADRQVRN